MKFLPDESEQKDIVDKCGSIVVWIWDDGVGSGPWEIASFRHNLNPAAV